MSAGVADALEEGGLDAGRKAVAQIVGRDTAELDEAGVARAAIESLAENFSDGVVAPTFWMVIAGLPGAALYKAINTADSMIGHRTERHQDFGWAAARLDDLVNLPASRLSALLIVAAAAIDQGCLGRRRRGAAMLARRPQARLAQCRLSGSGDGRRARPRAWRARASMAARWSTDAWMGDGRREATRRRHPRRARALSAAPTGC